MNLERQTLREKPRQGPQSPFSVVDISAAKLCLTLPMAGSFAPLGRGGVSLGGVLAVQQ